MKSQATCPLCFTHPVPLVDRDGYLSIGQHSHPIPVFPSGPAGAMYSANCPMSGAGLRLHVLDRTAPELANTIEVSSAEIRLGDRLVQWSFNGNDWRPAAMSTKSDLVVTSIAHDRIRCGADTFSISDDYRWRVLRRPEVK